MSKNFKSAFGRKTISRKARFEALENRRLLTVTVKAANQDIFISGDNANNQLAVFEDGAGRLFIYGGTGTAIAGDGVVSGVIPDTNAGGGREFDNGLFKNIFINMGSGDDLVQFAGLRASDINFVDVKTGDAPGADIVSFGQTTFAGNPDTAFGINATSKAVSITTGNGNDTVTVDALTAPSLSITTGAGNDNVGIAQNDNVVVNGDVSISVGDGTNSVLGATNSHTFVVDGGLNISSGSGDDSVTLDGVTVGNVAGNLNIQTGAGDDTVSLGTTGPVSVSHGSLSIDAGDSTTRDTVTVGAGAAVTVSGNTAITSGSGNTLDNQLNIDSLITTNLSVNAGSAADSIKIAQNGDVSIHGDLSLNAGNGGNFVAVGASSASLSVNGNVSIVTGSGNDDVVLNNLTVGNVLGDLTIQTGASDDTINVGSTDAVVVSNGSLKIATGDATAQDTVNIGIGAAVTLSGNTAIVTGNGNDVVNVQSLSASSVAVNTGAGNDQVTLNHVTSSGYISANLGSATNTLILSNSTAQAVTVTGGAGADTTNFDADTFVSLTLNAGNGKNVIHLKNSTISQATSLTTGTGADQVFLAGVHAEALAIYTGDGNDKVSIGSATIIDHLLAKLGAGDDTFIASNSTFTGQDIVDGGKGKNSIKFSKVKRVNTLAVFLGAFHL
jgi:hypothetical protein